MKQLLRTLLSGMFVCLATTGIVRADFNPDNPPEPMAHYKVTVSATPADATSSISLGGSYSIGKQLSISVTPATGYRFLYWTLNGEQYTTNRTFTYTVGREDADLVAHLAKNPVLTVSVTPSAAGTAYGGGSYEPGSSKRIYTYGNNGYTFQHWTLNGEQYTTETSFNYTVGNEDVSFVAVYTKDEVQPEPFNPENPLEPMVYYLVDVTTNLPDGVKPTSLTPRGSYSPGRNITIKTNVPDGYVFLYWTLNDVLYSEQLSCPYVVGDSNVVFRACFAQKRTITLLVTPEGAGTVSGAGTYAPNTKVLVSTTPRDGYAFLYWTHNDEVYAETLAFYYIVNATDEEFVAVYEQIDTPPDTPVVPDDPNEPFNPSNPPEPETNKVALNITVGVNDAELGSVTGLPNRPLFAGDVITLTAVSSNPELYNFLHWADGNTSNPRQITVSVDARYVAVFSKHFTVTFYDEDSITVLDRRQWEYGELPTCVSPAKPSDEQFSYRFAGWMPEIVPLTGEAAYYATYVATPLPAAEIENITMSSLQCEAGTFDLEFDIRYINQDGELQVWLDDDEEKTTVEYAALNIEEQTVHCSLTAPVDNSRAMHSLHYSFNKAGYSSGSMAVQLLTGSYESLDTFMVAATQLPYTVHGCTYSEAGTYERGFTTVNGCDSIYHITIDVLPVGVANVSVTGVISAEDLDLGTSSTVKIGSNGHLVVTSPVYVHKLSLDYSNARHAQVSGVGNIHAEVVEVLQNFPKPKGSLSGHWFTFAVPFEVSVATGIRISGSDTPARSGYDFVIDEFDGVKRATQQQGWKRVAADAILRPGRMYMFATPKSTSWILTAADPSELTEQTRTIISANSSTIGANHSGWNGIANTMYANSTAGNNGIAWATTYNNVLGVYETQETSDYVFKASAPFFVQVAKDLLFSFDDIPLSAPQRVQEDETPVFSKLMLTDAEEVYTDKAYISFVTDKEEDTYLIGHDLQKMAANSQYVHQLWLEAYGMQLSAYEAPLGDEPRSIPIGIYAPAAGNYTLQMSNAPANISIYLTENGQPVWDIASSAYTLNLPAGNNNSYALYVQRVQNVVTDYMTTGEQLTVQKVIVDDRIFIIRNGKTYNVTGIQVK